MPQSQKNRAWNRGARLAILYKQMKVNLLNLDKICVTHKIERERYEIDQDVGGYLMYLYATIGQ